MPLSHTIREICVPLAEYPHVLDTATLRDAFEVLHADYAGSRRDRHVLLSNDRRQLGGLPGMRDILGGLFPGYPRGRALAHHTQGPVPDFPFLMAVLGLAMATLWPLLAMPILVHRKKGTA